MVILQFILIAVEIICSLLLLVLILMQKSRSEGLGLAFGSGMGEALFGSRAGNVLTKMTIIFACVFLVNTLFLSLTYSGSRGQSIMGRFLGGGMRPAPVEKARPEPRPAPGETAPAMPAGGVPTLPGTPLDEQPVSAPSQGAQTPPAGTPSSAPSAPAE